MVVQVSPPNPNQVFVQYGGGDDGSLILSSVANRFLTNIVQALNGQPSVTITNQEIFQFRFGNVTLSTGAIDTPETFLTGTLGDAFISTTIGLGPGNCLFLKESGVDTTTGWVAIG